MIYYFAYGSNMSYQRIAARVSQCESLGVYYLPQYQFKCHKVGLDGSAKGNAFYTGDESRIYGVLYALSDADKTLLDTIEGVGKGYECRKVTVYDYSSAYTSNSKLTHASLKLSNLRSSNLKSSNVKSSAETTNNQQEKSAYLYAATNIDDRLLPFCWYKHHIEFGAAQAKLPERYRKQISQLPCQEDPDTQRAAMEMAIYI